MRVLVLLIALFITILSCGSITETLIKTGVEITTPQAPIKFSTGDTLLLDISIQNVSDTAIKIYIGERAFYLLDLRGIEYTGDNEWAHNVGQEPPWFRLEADSQVTLALRFVEILQRKGPDQFNAKAWYSYGWGEEGKAYRYSIVSRDPILIEVKE